MAKQSDSHIKRYENLTVVSEMAKTSLIGDEFDASLDTLTQIWQNKLDKRVLERVEKISIGSNVTKKALR